MLVLPRRLRDDRSERGRADDRQAAALATHRGRVVVAEHDDPGEDEDAGREHDGDDPGDPAEDGRCVVRGRTAVGVHLALADPAAEPDVPAHFAAGQQHQQLEVVAVVERNARDAQRVALVAEAAFRGEVVHQVVDVGRLGDRDAAYRAVGEHGGQTVRTGTGVVVAVDAERTVVLDAEQHEGGVGHALHLVEHADTPVGPPGAGVVADRAVHLDAVADPLAARHPALVPDHHGGRHDAEHRGAHGDDVLRAQPVHGGCPRNSPEPDGPVTVREAAGTHPA